jgi:hypothetical protein
VQPIGDRAGGPNAQPQLIAALPEPDIEELERSGCSAKGWSGASKARDEYRRAADEDQQDPRQHPRRPTPAHHLRMMRRRHEPGATTVSRRSASGWYARFDGRLLRK